MAINVVDEFAPKNNGTFPLMADKYVYINGDKTIRLSEYLKTLGAGTQIFTAGIDVQSDADVKITDITIPDGMTIKVNDLLLDSNGDMYTITAVAADTVHVSNALPVNLKGPGGDSNIRIATNEEIDALFND